jgi:TRAP-type transport system small permease protein
MKRVLDSYCKFLRILLTLLMGLMIVPVCLQILSRYTGFIPRYIWTEEIARFCFVWIIMIGAMIAVRDGTHFDVDLLPRPKSRKAEGLFRIIRHLAMLLMAFVFAWDGIDFAKFGWMQNSEMSGINMMSIYISFPLAGFTWILFLSEKLKQDIDLIRHSKPEGRS